MIEQTDLKEQHKFILCLCVADPATFLASNSVLAPLFSSESSLFIQLWIKINILVCIIITSLIL